MTSPNVAPIPIRSVSKTISVFGVGWGCPRIMNMKSITTAAMTRALDCRLVLRAEKGWNA